MKRSPLLPLLLLACSNATPPEHYGFVAVLGNDTVSVERIARSPTRLVTDGVDRWPFVRRRHTEFDLAADGTIRHMVMDVRTPNGRSPRERGRRVTADFTKPRGDDLGPRQQRRAGHLVRHRRSDHRSARVDDVQRHRAGDRGGPPPRRGGRPRAGRQRAVPAVLSGPGRRTELHAAPGLGAPACRGQGGAAARLVVGNRRRDGRQRRAHADLLGDAEHLQGRRHANGDRSRHRSIGARFAAAERSTGLSAAQRARYRTRHHRRRDLLGGLRPSPGAGPDAAGRRDRLRPRLAHGRERRDPAHHLGADHARGSVGAGRDVHPVDRAARQSAST